MRAGEALDMYTDRASEAVDLLEYFKNGNEVPGGFTGIVPGELEPFNLANLSFS